MSQGQLNGLDAPALLEVKGSERPPEGMRVNLPLIYTGVSSHPLDSGVQAAFDHLLAKVIQKQVVAFPFGTVLEVF